MELTPGRQRLVFVLIVVALAGLGVYLIRANESGTPAAAPSPSASTVAPPASATTPGIPPSSLPTPTPVSTAGGAEIYQWLPFTPADLTAAAQATASFAKDYVTWSYTESGSAYGATMQNLVTAEYLPVIEEGYETPGVAQQRTADKQVSTGSGTIDQITSFGANPTTISFLVTINQQVTSTQQPTTASPQQYTVTVVSSGGTWQVNNMELLSQGNS
jgi:hypothetical protein